MTELTQEQEQLCQDAARLAKLIEAHSIGMDDVAMDLALATVFGRKVARGREHFSTSLAVFKEASFEAFREARMEARRG